MTSAPRGWRLLSDLVKKYSPAFKGIAGRLRLAGDLTNGCRGRYEYANGRGRRYWATD
jgi:hypothetical protein